MNANHETILDQLPPFEESFAKIKVCHRTLQFEGHFCKD